MTPEQIDHLVNRFLSWKLPEDFRPDNGISFDPVGNRGVWSYEYKREPTGTNLLTATQAKAMVLHLLDGLPQTMTTTPELEAVARAIAPSRWAVMDGYLADMLRKYKGQNVAYDPDQFKDQESLATAQAALAALGLEVRKIEGDA